MMAGIVLLTLIELFFLKRHSEKNNAERVAVV
jgi:hypothetical protein